MRFHDRYAERMRRLIVPAALTAVLLLAGCSSADSEPAEYDTVEDLRAAFVGAGGTCDSWEAGTAVGAWAQYGNCGELGDPDEAVLSIYTSDDDLQSSVDGVKDSGAENMTQMLVGPNWIIQAADVAKVRETLGGTVVNVG